MMKMRDRESGGERTERLSPLRLPVNLHHFYFLCTFLVASQNNSFSEAIT